jgi:hypothetical protein
MCCGAAGAVRSVPGERKKEFFLSPDPSKAVPSTLLLFFELESFG